MKELAQKNEAKSKVNKYLEHRSDRLVNFIICGTQKGGTSALDAYLREHHEICMANNKEVHFFDSENFFVTNHPTIPGIIPRSRPERCIPCWERLRRYTCIGTARQGVFGNITPT
jgi:hypothetical protein